MTIPEIVRSLPKNFLLKAGSHDDFERGACVMESVAWLAGEPFSDAPRCACPVVRTFAMRLNDRIDNDALRTELLLPFVVSMVGSKSTDTVAAYRARLAADWAIRGSLAIWWDEVSWLKPVAEKLRAMAPLVTSEALKEAATMLRAEREAMKSRAAAYVYAAAYAAADAAADAAYAAAAADAAYAAADAYSAAAAAADADAYSAAADAAAADADAADETLDEKIAAARARLRPIREAVWRSQADCIGRMLQVTPETTEHDLAALAYRVPA
jgi:hypothetical protein